MSAKSKLKEYLLGKSDSPPAESVGVDGTLIREVMEAKQSEILGAVNSALDDKFSRFEPLLAKAEEDDKKRKEEEEDVKALAQLNERRIARGLKPLAMPEEDDDKKEEAPGKHEKKSKSEKENPFKKEEDDDKKDEAISKLTEKVSALEVMLKASQTRNLGEESFDFGSSTGDSNRLTLVNGGKTVPFKKTWEFAKWEAPSIRGAMASQGFPQAAIDEFDVAVANLQFDLQEAGVLAVNRKELHKIHQLGA